MDRWLSSRDLRTTNGYPCARLATARCAQHQGPNPARPQPRAATNSQICAGTSTHANISCAAAVMAEFFAVHLVLCLTHPINPDQPTVRREKEFPSSHGHARAPAADTEKNTPGAKTSLQNVMRNFPPVPTCHSVPAFLVLGKQFHPAGTVPVR